MKEYMGMYSMIDSTAIKSQKVYDDIKRFLYDCEIFTANNDYIKLLCQLNIQEIRTMLQQSALDTCPNICCYTKNIMRIIDGINKKFSSIKDPIDRKRQQNEFRDKLNEIIETSITKNKLNPDDLKKLNNIDKLIEETKEEFRKNNWNNFSCGFGIGQGCLSEDSTWRQLHSTMISYSFNISTPFIKFSDSYRSQLIGLFQYNSFIGNSDDSTKKDNALAAGCRWLVGSDKNRFSFEALYSYNKFQRTESFNENLRITIGYEFQVMDGLWVELAIGSDRDPKNYKNTSLLTLFDFKYAIGGSSRKLY